MEQFNVEVELVERDKLDDPGAAFDGFVCRAEDFSGIRYITVLYSEAFGDAMVDLCFENYYIKNIYWQDGPNTPLDKVGFVATEEDQNEAFETIRELLEKNEEASAVDRRNEEMRSQISGPKRMEVSLVRRNSPKQTKTMIVSRVFPPTGAFKYYCLSGRTRLSAGNYAAPINGINDNDWDITQISTFSGGRPYSSTVFFSNGDGRNQAWDSVFQFYNGMTESEKKVIENWDVPNTGSPLDDDDGWELGLGAGHYSGGYAGQNYYNRSPYTYTPPKADLRTAGDDIGAKIYREQAEKQAQYVGTSSALDICAYLDATDISEKKAEAETKQEAASAETPSKPWTKDTGSGRDGSTGGTRASGPCIDCGSLICKGCLKKDGISGTEPGTKADWRTPLPGHPHLQLCAEKDKPTVH